MVFLVFSSRRAVLLMIVIRRANVSFQITAGKFSPFSLEFFNAVSGKKKKKKKFFRFFENFKSSISINVFHSGIENIRWISFRVTGHERQAGRGKITRNDLLLLVYFNNNVFKGFLFVRSIHRLRSLNLCL